MACGDGSGGEITKGLDRNRPLCVGYWLSKRHLLAPCFTCRSQYKPSESTHDCQFGFRAFCFRIRLGHPSSCVNVNEVACTKEINKIELLGWLSFEPPTGKKVCCRGFSKELTN